MTTDPTPCPPGTRILVEAEVRKNGLIVWTKPDGTGVYHRRLGDAIVHGTVAEWERLRAELAELRRFLPRLAVAWSNLGAENARLRQERINAIQDLLEAKTLIGALWHAMGIPADADADLVAEVRAMRARDKPGCSKAHEELATVEAELAALRAEITRIANDCATEWGADDLIVSRLRAALAATMPLKPATIDAETRTGPGAGTAKNDGLDGQQRPQGVRPFVAFNPAMRFGQATINNTQLSIESVAGMLWAGEGMETVLDEYSLTRPDVIVACWFMGAHGPKKWRKRWGAWAQQIHPELWHSRYDVPDPPEDDAK